MGMNVALLVPVIAMSAVGSAHAADFFVVTDTFTLQHDAQSRAATIGGWVLDTDAYSGLPPNLFAVVRGPYANRRTADQRLKELKAVRTYKAAYVKEAGTLRVGPALARSVSPKVLTALLGELSV